MTWKNSLLKGMPYQMPYKKLKSKFWGDKSTVPNELGAIVGRIYKMPEEERNTPEIQRDIDYIKELIAEQTKLMEKYLHMIGE
jgi:hypothetical protein